MASVDEHIESGVAHL